MQRSLAASRTRVVDASLAVWAVLPAVAVAGVDVLTELGVWRQSGIRLVAPVLWLAEATSAIRATVYTRQISIEEGRVALRDMFDLPIETLQITAESCQAAFEWAARLQQAKAYDAFYLAVADELNAEFWTADRRLVNGARQAGMARVHWIGDS
ncbi:MAG TPA: type II toxin-antitoxin system VapC family toxin [Chloroflexia bacterium]|nr:type II toxin-antitoxin system VapC family toxin [Chloroflexia bacterium]